MFGYTTSKNRYYVDSTKTNVNTQLYTQEYKTKTDDKVFVINKNIYDNSAYLDESDNISIFEDDKYDNIIASTSVSPTILEQHMTLHFLNLMD